MATPDSDVSRQDVVVRLDYFSVASVHRRLMVCTKGSRESGISWKKDVQALACEDRAKTFRC